MHKQPALNRTKAGHEFENFVIDQSRRKIGKAQKGKEARDRIGRQLGSNFITDRVAEEIAWIVAQVTALAGVPLGERAAIACKIADEMRLFLRGLKLVEVPNSIF